MRLRTLPTPGFDETLSSWLFRCSFNKKILNFRRVALIERPTQWWEGLELKSSDPDVDFLSASQRMVAGREYINPQLLGNYFSLRNGTPVVWELRRYFCPDCLRADVSSGHLPMWRKSWCYESSCICSLHGRELITLYDPSRYSKAWDAFVQDCNSISVNTRKVNLIFNRFRTGTLMKIRHALESQSVSPNFILVNLFNSLVRIFLHSPFNGSRGGAARIHFQSKKGMRFADPISFEQSILKGASTADPTCRFGSIVFAASLLGIIPLSRFLMFTKLCEDAKTNILIPQDLHQAAAFPYVDRAGYLILHRQLGGFPRKKFPLLDHHLKIQEERYSRDGVLAFHPFGITNVK